MFRQQSHPKPEGMNLHYKQVFFHDSVNQATYSELSQVIKARMTIKFSNI